MRSRHPPAAVSVKLSALTIAAIVAALTPAPAAAWCRASAQTGSQGECVPNPTSAPILFWERSCTTYHFNDQLFSSIDLMNEREVRAAFRAGFEVWAAIDCGDGAPFFVEQRSGTTRTALSEYRRDGANESVVIAIPAARWTSLEDHPPNAVALTLMWHNSKTGEILDTDMELNLGAGSFADCVADGCGAGMVDLQNTIAHEAGHVLGLGHSTDKTATMAAQSVGSLDAQKRTLAPDDIAGYCALDLPASQCSGDSCSCSSTSTHEPASTGRTSGCQINLSGTSGTGWQYVLLALAWARRRRRA